MLCIVRHHYDYVCLSLSSVVGYVAQVAFIDAHKQQVGDAFVKPVGVTVIMHIAAAVVNLYALWSGDIVIVQEKLALSLENQI